MKLLCKSIIALNCIFSGCAAGPGLCGGNDPHRWREVAAPATHMQLVEIGKLDRGNKPSFDHSAWYSEVGGLIMLCEFDDELSSTPSGWWWIFDGTRIVSEAGWVYVD